MQISQKRKREIWVWGGILIFFSLFRNEFSFNYARAVYMCEIVCAQHAPYLPFLLIYFTFSPSIYYGNSI